MNKIKNILITNETNNNFNQNNKSSLINKNSIIPHLNKNISNLNNNLGITNYHFEHLSQLSNSYMTNYKNKFFKTKTDLKVQNNKYMKKMIKNYYESINHNNISHNIFSIQKMSKTNTRFINRCKNFNCKKNIKKGKNICHKNNKINRKNKSKNNSNILYFKLINNNFSYSTNSKNSKSHSNKKNKKQKNFNNFNESLKKKVFTGNNTNIINKISKNYNNMKKNLNKNNIYI